MHQKFTLNPKSLKIFSKKMVQNWAGPARQKSCLNNYVERENIKKAKIAFKFLNIFFGRNGMILSA
jgi:hypothetical protein